MICYNNAEFVLSYFPSCEMRGKLRQTVATLIIGGSDVNGPDNDGIRPIHWATIFGRTNLIPVLGDAGANIDAQDPYGNSPLHIAAWSGDMDMVTALVAEGAQLEAVNKIGETPLQWAQRNGQVSIIKLLLAVYDNTSLAMGRCHG